MPRLQGFCTHIAEAISFVKRIKKNKEYGLNPDGTKKPAEKINTIEGHRDGGRSMKSEL